MLETIFIFCIHNYTKCVLQQICQYYCIVTDSPCNQEVENYHNWSFCCKHTLSLEKHSYDQAGDNRTNKEVNAHKYQIAFIQNIPVAKFLIIHFYSLMGILIELLYYLLILIYTQIIFIMSESETSDLKKYLPKPYKKRRYYIKSQLAQHCQANDLWISFFHDIYDLTELVQKNIASELVQPLINAAGTDITHWFDDKTKEPRTFVTPEGKIEYFCPNGPYLDLKIAKVITQIPWWRNQKYFIGKLTKKSQYVRIINTLSDTQDKLEVPQQETIWQILDRYQQINCHARSYTWKRMGNVLNMDLNLKENGIVDYSDEYDQYQVAETQQYVPALHLHFNDDLTSK